MRPHHHDTEGGFIIVAAIIGDNGEFNHRKERKTMLMDNIDLWCAKYKD